MPEVTLEPGNPYDFEDLEEFAERVRDRNPDVDVVVARRPERGYGVTLWEVLNVFWDVTEAVSTLGGAYAIFDLVVEYAQERWRKDREEHGDRARPRTVTLYGPDDQPLKAVKIEAPDGEPAPADLPEPRPKPGRQD